MCRTTRPKREFLRVVRTPDGRVLVDPTGRRPGRGAYVCAVGECRAKALERGALARALHVGVPTSLGEQLGGAESGMNEGGDQRGTE